MKKFKLLSFIIICVMAIACLSACSGNKDDGDVLSILSDYTSAEASSEQSVSSENEAEVPSVAESSQALIPEEKKPTQSVASKTEKPAASAPAPSRPAKPQKTAKDIVIGKWKGSADIAPALVESGIQIEGEQIVSCVIEFTSNGTLIERIDRESFRNALKSILQNAINQSLADEQITKEDFEAQIGMTVEEYIDATIEETMTIAPLNIANDYRFEGNDLYIRQDGEADFVKTEYSLSGENKLTLVEDGMSIDYTRIS